MSATKMRRSRAKPQLRAVFDANVYIAKALSKNPSSPNAELFELLKVDAYLLFWCDEIRTEVAEKLLTKGLTGEHIAEYIAQITSLALWVEVPLSAKRRYVTQDPDDDIIIACAAVAKATHIVSYDHHLLNLKEPFPGCIVLDSLHFLFLLRGDKPPLKERIRSRIRSFIKT